VKHSVGNALALPFDGGAFDVVWTQNSGMNIADKEQLYAGFCRVLRPGGLLAIQEPMAGPVQPPIFPLMWARDPSQSFLRTPAKMRGLIERTGFRARAWDDITAEAVGPATAPPRHAVQRLIMGEALEAIMQAGQRNREEGRIVMVQAVFERSGLPGASPS
jgi:SAM-dependent methyltransferase